MPNSTKPLSPREEEIVQLCVDGLTNDAIAHRLNLSVGTVNTYWLRIKLKVGGSGRTDTVARIIKERAEVALRAANVEHETLVELLAAKERGAMELRASLALLHLAMDQIKSTVWATDLHLNIQALANGEFPSTHFGVVWEAGIPVYDIFKTTDPNSPAIAAHLAALKGIEDETRLTGEFENMHLRVAPLRDEAGEILGCVSIVNLIDKARSGN
ncbi:MAG: LuxR C-terminal-related transcriptional regulator [Fimbriimonadaceae bacterium]